MLTLCGIYTSESTYIIMYIICVFQEQASLIKEGVEVMPGDSPPLFDSLGEGVDLSELAAASVAESAVDPGAGRRGTVSYRNRKRTCYESCFESSIYTK